MRILDRTNEQIAVQNPAKYRNARGSWKARIWRKPVIQRLLKLTWVLVAYYGATIRFLAAEHPLVAADHAV